MTLLTAWLTHSHHVLFLINSMSFSVYLERASACILLGFFFFLFFLVTLTERLVLPLSTGRRSAHCMFLDIDVNSPSFRERPILLFPTWCPCFPSLLFSFPALCCHPFHQDCLPGASGVHFCSTAWLQGQKHPSFIQTLTWIESVFSKPRPVVELNNIPWNDIRLKCRWDISSLKYLNYSWFNPGPDYIVEGDLIKNFFFPWKFFK